MYQKQEPIAATKQPFVGLPCFHWNWLVYFLLNDVIYLPSSHFSANFHF